MAAQRRLLEAARLPADQRPSSVRRGRGRRHGRTPSRPSKALSNPTGRRGTEGIPNDSGPRPVGQGYSAAGAAICSGAVGAAGSGEVAPRVPRRMVVRFGAASALVARRVPAPGGVLPPIAAAPRLPPLVLAPAGDAVPAGGCAVVLRVVAAALCVVPAARRVVVPALRRVAVPAARPVVVPRVAGAALRVLAPARPVMAAAPPARAPPRTAPLMRSTALRISASRRATDFSSVASRLSRPAIGSALTRPITALVTSPPVLRAARLVGVAARPRTPPLRPVLAILLLASYPAIAGRSPRADLAGREHRTHSCRWHTAWSVHPALSIRAVRAMRTGAARTSTRQPAAESGEVGRCLSYHATSPPPLRPWVPRSFPPGRVASDDRLGHSRRAAWRPCGRSVGWPRAVTRPVGGSTPGPP